MALWSPWKHGICCCPDMRRALLPRFVSRWARNLLFIREAGGEQEPVGRSFCPEARLPEWGDCQTIETNSLAPRSPATLRGWNHHWVGGFVCHVSGRASGVRGKGLSLRKVQLDDDVHNTTRPADDKTRWWWWWPKGIINAGRYHDAVHIIRGAKSRRIVSVRK